jgi:hypothetical protein
VEHFAGSDVSLELTSVCIVDERGAIIREAKVASEPEVLIGFLRAQELEIARVGLEAGPLSQWDTLTAGADQREIAQELLSPTAGVPRWRSRESSVRSQAQRLVRSARGFAAGGYRALLG